MDVKDVKDGNEVVKVHAKKGGRGKEAAGNGLQNVWKFLCQK
jgi:hypothetical protein